MPKNKGKQNIQQVSFISTPIDANFNKIYDKNLRRKEQNKVFTKY
jgi:hypothetical protein